MPFCLSVRFSGALLLSLVGAMLAGAALGPGTAQGQPANRQTASKGIHGSVRDAESGRPLPSASIFVDGTRRGTITNEEGRYRLRIDSLPATVVFRYVGFEEERLQVDRETPSEQNVSLTPATAARERVTVTAQRTTAEEIMRRVISVKQERRRRLHTFEADAYNRFVVRNDTGIVSVVESLTKFFWDRQKGSREIVLSQRQTENLGLRSALPAGLFMTNLYDDEIEVAGHHLVGVTHPEALEHYRFRIDTVRALDGRAVFDLAVEPRGRFESGFRGRIAVLDEAYALLEAELEPARSFLFPPPIRDLSVTYRQQFSNFGKDYWLPISLRSTVQADINLPLLLSFPTFRIEQVSRLSDYRLNVPLPDSLFREEEQVRVAGLQGEGSVPSDSLIEAEGSAVVPLSSVEARAVQTIDSTQTLAEAFTPEGPLGWLMNLQVGVDEEGEDGEDAGSGGEAEQADRSEDGGALDVDAAPRLWFNRVEGGHLGARATLRLNEETLALTGLGGYQTARGDWTYGGGLELGLPADVAFEADYRYEVAPRYTSQVYSLRGTGGRFVNSFNVLLGGNDYFDYYGSERWRFRLSRDFSVPSGEAGLKGHVRAGLRVERSFPVRRHTSFDLVGRDEPQPLNPPVPRMRLRSITAGLRLGRSSPGATLGITGRRRLTLAAEWAPEDFLGSEADFWHFEGTLDYRWETFLRRRLLPMTLDVRLTGGTFAGQLPLHRYTIVEAPLGVIGPFGTLRTLEGSRPYEGAQHLAAFWEHNFRTAPFEAVGLYALAQRGWNVLLFGGHGRTCGDDGALEPLEDDAVFLKVPEGFHHEVGIGLSGLVGLLRIDLAKRLDAEGWALRVGLARAF